MVAIQYPERTGSGFCLGEMFAIGLEIVIVEEEAEMQDG
jgi:ribosomal protein L13E